MSRIQKFNSGEVDSDEDELSEKEQSNLDYILYLFPERKVKDSDDQIGTDIFHKVKSLLTCPICLDIYTEPVLIKKCLHRFCKKCIEKVIRSQVNKTCPACRIPLGCKRILRNDEVTEKTIKQIFPNLSEYQQWEEAHQNNYYRSKTKELKIRNGAMGRRRVEIDKVKRTVSTPLPETSENQEILPEPSPGPSTKQENSNPEPKNEESIHRDLTITHPQPIEEETSLRELFDTKEEIKQSPKEITEEPKELAEEVEALKLDIEEEPVFTIGEEISDESHEANSRKKRGGFRGGFRGGSRGGGRGGYRRRLEEVEDSETRNLTKIKSAEENGETMKPPVRRGRKPLNMENPPTENLIQRALRGNTRSSTSKPSNSHITIIDKDDETIEIHKEDDDLEMVMKKKKKNPKNEVILIDENGDTHPPVVDRKFGQLPYDYPVSMLGYNPYQVQDPSYMAAMQQLYYSKYMAQPQFYPTASIILFMTRMTVQMMMNPYYAQGLGYSRYFAKPMGQMVPRPVPKDNSNMNDWNQFFNDLTVNRTSKEIQEMITTMGPKKQELYQ